MKFWVYRPDKANKSEVDLSLLYSPRGLTYWQEKEREDAMKQPPAPVFKKPQQVEVPG